MFFPRPATTQSYLSYFSIATMSAVPALFHLPRQLRQIDRVNQLAHPSKISPMRYADQPGKLAQLGFILLLPERFARVKRLPLKKIRKLLVQFLDCSIADRSLQTNHHF